MIKENIKNITVRSIVTRICDDCGKEEEKTLGEVLYSKNRKKTGKDYCKRCCYKHRLSSPQKGEKSTLWKGGKSLTKNGYYRINGGKNKGAYEHKIIYGDHIGRKILRTEKIHHIDMNKLNNDTNNMYLCKNKKDHSKIHSQMEDLAFSLFEKYIWFDKENKIYTLKKHINESVNFEVEKEPSCVGTWRNGKKYSYIYIGHRKYRSTHRYVMEKFLKREIYRWEQVHHIDGKSLYNSINNLILLGRSEHRKAHNSLQKCVSKLYIKGIVEFEFGRYYVV